jgi:hypothetical protein
MLWNMKGNEEIKRNTRRENMTVGSKKNPSEIFLIAFFLEFPFRGSEIEIDKLRTAKGDRRRINTKHKTKGEKTRLKNQKVIGHRKTWQK